MTKRAEKYAEHYRIDPSTIAKEPLSNVPVFHVQAFAHPDIPVITNEQPDRIQFFHWGLIPFWVKDVASATKMSNRTVNARGEEMFEKPSFRSSARKKRCIVVADAFFEHHWENGKSYPFLVKFKDDAPMSLAGLWECWRNEKEGIERYSVSIITTSANSLMNYVHNNPKASHVPRMPLILPREWEQDWLQAPNDPIGIQKIKSMVCPYNPSEMQAFPVDRLRGKSYRGNIPEIQEAVHYPELGDNVPG